MMSRKASRLYGRMQRGIAQKKADVDELHKRRKELDRENAKKKSDGDKDEDGGSKKRQKKSKKKSN